MELKNKYSKEELREFEGIIKTKLNKAKEELHFMKDGLSNQDAHTDNEKSAQIFEGNSFAMEKENLSQLATRQRRFVSQLEDSLQRIYDGNYGVCAETGKLINKERLRVVPHTTHSLEAKLKKR